MTIYPIARGTLVNIAAFTSRYDLEDTPLDGPSVVDVPREEFLQDFARWEPEVQALLDVRPPCSSVLTVTPAAHIALPTQHRCCCP